MKKTILVLVFLICVLTSCNQTVKDNQKESDTSDEMIQTGVVMNENEIQPETLLQEEVTVSPYAVEDFLLPLENYCWEKEFDAEFVMIHFTSNVVNDRINPYDIEKIRDIFLQNEISIHYIIDRDGIIRCYIPETHSAWHAGKGTYGDDEKYTDKMNRYSIGIELVAFGSKNDMSQYLTSDEYDMLDKSLLGFTDKQYASLKTLVDDICTRNNIPFDRNHVIGHSEYNDKKSDPGELFDWDRLFS